jgi:formylglycine-generating enzyme required for sulfatase activity
MSNSPNNNAANNASISDKVREAYAKLRNKLTQRAPSKPMREPAATGNDDKDKPIRETRPFKAALTQARTLLARELPRVSAYALDLGMAGGMACAISVIASTNLTNGLSQPALLTLMSGLGVNWLSSRVEQWRDKARQMSADDVRQLAEEIDPNLNDTKLREVLADLELIPMLLAQVKDDQTRLNALVRELNERGLASRDELLSCANKVQVNIGGDVIGSLVTTAGGHISWNNVTVNLGVNDVERERLDNAIEAHLNGLRRQLRKLDLDAIGGTIADTEDSEFELAEIYTPLLTPVSSIENFGKELVEPARQSFKSLMAALNDHPRAVVLGDPGSGKSTALKYLALGLCGLRADETFAEEWRHVLLVPLWVELRNFAQQATLVGDAPDVQLLNYIRKKLPHGAEALREHLDLVLRKRGAAFLLDGLDEVPPDKRELVKDAIEGLMRLYGRCRYIITCRGYAYQDKKQKLRSPVFEMAELKVLELEDEQIELFVRKWYKQLHDRRGKPDLSNDLVTQLQDKGNPRLRRLASNPLLLTLIATLHSTGLGKLPNERQLLLKEAVDLLLMRWQRIKKPAEQELLSPPFPQPLPPAIEAEIKVFNALEQANAKEELLSELYTLAFEVHKQAPDQQIAQSDATADIPEDMLRNALERVLRGALGNKSILPDDLTEYLRNRAGLLINAGDEPNTPAESLSQKRPVYRFPHRMFQEYMAGMRYYTDPAEVAPLVKKDFARWREVYALMALINSEPGTRDCLEEICPLGETPQNDVDWQCAVLAANTWADKLKPTVNLSQGIKRHIAHVARLINDLLRTPALLSPAERAEAGRVLARLPSSNPTRFTCGDERYAACADLSTAEGWREYLDTGFVQIEPREFTMQMGTEYAEVAQVAEPYAMGKTPVTCAQFAAFVRAGYGLDRLWTPNGLQWRRNLRRNLRSKNTEPYLWDDARWNISNHPVVGVTWYEAVAYCNWLTELSKSLKISDPLTFSLPSELEWEFATRGTAGRQYPWKRDGSEGWQEGDERRCNTRETGLGRTSAVGIFVDGATPDEIFDLSGNVWEWTSTQYDGDWRKTKQPSDMAELVVLRGGSWARLHDYGLGNRDRLIPDDRYDHIGFRVVVRLPLLF